MRNAALAFCTILLAVAGASTAQGQIVWQPPGRMPVPDWEPAIEPAAEAALDTPAGLDDAVGKAIEKAVAAIWSTRREDGSWSYGNTPLMQYSMGVTALAAYALLESGVNPQDPRMAVTLAWLAKHDDNTTYSHSLRAQVWLLANPKINNKYRREFELDVKRLMLSAYEGKYTYYAIGDSNKHPYDNSNSQFGVLGVWAGARANMEFIGPNYWAAVMRHWLASQHADGGWDYVDGNLSVWPSMTAAGLATLFVCIDNLAPSEVLAKCKALQGPQYRAVEKGLDWMEKNFEDSLRPNFGPPAMWNRYMTYYLYSIERVALASGYKYFGKSDWYKTGAKWLLRRQKPDGTWRDVWDDAFALLFLTRGRNPVLFNKLWYNGDWNNRPRALASLTDYISRNFEHTVHWQIVSAKSPVSEWHDAPILFLSGSRMPTFTDEELGKLKTYVLQGGTILSVQECGDFSFGTGMRKAYAKMFPDYELAAAPKDHDIYSVQFPLKGRPQFFLLSNGVRPLAIHVESDMVLPWQAKEEKTEAWAFQAAANVFFYVTDSTLRSRGTRHWPEPATQPPRHTVKLARLKYPGNWDPEPLAFERFALMLVAAGIRLEVTPVAIGDLPGSGAAIATLTGTAEFHASPRNARQSGNSWPAGACWWSTPRADRGPLASRPRTCFRIPSGPARSRGCPPMPASSRSPRSTSSSTAGGRGRG
jgi:hypothetical protein